MSMIMIMMMPQFLSLFLSPKFWNISFIMMLLPAPLLFILVIVIIFLNYFIVVI